MAEIVRHRCATAALAAGETRIQPCPAATVTQYDDITSAARQGYTSILRQSERDRGTLAAQHNTSLSS